tara:strand:- start:310 stop:414 length:105 start_codon:yes stop_codon:yes gene_type:complete
VSVWRIAAALFVGTVVVVLLEDVATALKDVQEKK